MTTLRSIPELAALEAPVALAIGVFDGFHRGHREVVQQAVEEAQRSGGSAAVATFEPHPVRVLAPEQAPRMLASIRHKEQLLAAAGVENLLEIPFDGAFARLSAEGFIGLLVDACRTLGFVAVGEDWRFGEGGAGDVALLRALGERHGFRVLAVPAVSHGGERISSTRIRAALRAGDLDLAADLLGRRYAVLGTVVGGRQLGRSLGVPTANLRVHQEQLPDGVYAVRARLGAEQFGGVANLGVRPTVEGEAGRRQLEVHLFEFGEEIYGEDLEVEFVTFLRGERAFDGLEALKAQIAEDIAAARAAL